VDFSAPYQEDSMSIVVELMIGGWIGTICMITFFALSESGQLTRIRKRVATWVENSAPVVTMPEENSQAEREDVA
jgi:hypothetical protein